MHFCGFGGRLSPSTSPLPLSLLPTKHKIGTLPSSLSLHPSPSLQKSPLPNIALSRRARQASTHPRWITDYTFNSYEITILAYRNICIRPQTVRTGAFPTPRNGPRY
ncbi:hypothetical protein TorRG33x02_044250 [Trema orientale]|uniref:Uncharacterized protein n=1 Tax=Trema orientale TaxID=63057 RepID=A0A2P5FPJ6_TREOI|nr:hypothetical protein TorRG33x02_044250 [Trema orientale]